jgi:chromosomal replication initiator protein
MVRAERSAVTMPPQPPAPARLDGFTDLFDRALKDRIGADRHRVWFEQKSRFDLDGDGLVVGVPNLFIQNWIAKTFAPALAATAADLLNRPVAVHFRIDPALFQAIRAEQQKVATSAATPEAPHAKPENEDRQDKPNGSPRVGGSPAKQKETPTLFDHLGPDGRAPKAAKRRWRTLTDFVAGPCNRVAHASALSVIEETGQGPNPLVIHGPVGTGKTHLLEGIYVGLKRRHAELQVLFVTAENFTNRFVNAVRFGKQGAFRKQFRGCDVLLLDDFHFLAKKKATQEEFLHTFDALLDEGRQVVLTCDCHPRLNDDFLPELLDRTLGGAIWGLLPPDVETRLAILRAKAGAATPPLPDEVLAFLADNLRGNVRELEGALHVVRHFARVAGRPIDVALAREALGDLLRHAIKAVHMADVEAAVCNVLRLPPGALHGAGRAWAVSHPRMLAVFLCRKHTAASYGEISKHFGGKSHSTAVAAEKTVRGWLQKGQAITCGGREWPVRDLIERVERELGR